VSAVRVLAVQGAAMPGEPNKYGVKYLVSGTIMGSTGKLRSSPYGLSRLKVAHHGS